MSYANTAMKPSHGNADALHSNYFVASHRLVHSIMHLSQPIYMQGEAQ